jgi:hypothetical protein
MGEVVDSLVHYSTIFEMNVESYRRRVAATRAPRKPRAMSGSKSDSENAKPSNRCRTSVYRMLEEVE